MIPPPHRKVEFPLIVEFAMFVVEEPPVWMPPAPRADVLLLTVLSVSVSVPFVMMPPPSIAAVLPVIVLPVIVSVPSLKIPPALRAE